MSRKLTIKELAAALDVSVPTLRKYGECGLLEVDSILGRTHLFDESGAIARIAEINRLKTRGFSLPLIRQRFNGRATVYVPPNLGLDGPEISLNRHVLVVVNDMPEFDAMAKTFAINGLRAGQAVAFLMRPEYRQTYAGMLRDAGFDVDDLERRKQLRFPWYERGDFDPVRQTDIFDEKLRGVLAAGWPIVRCLGHPDIKPESISVADQTRFEERLHELASKHPVSFVCSWLAPKHSAQTLLQMQRNHKEIVVGNATLVRA